MDKLGNGGSITRANRYTALALKSRAMLYAGSIAKYNNLLASPITTPGGEVGIPASRADEYYQKSLDASEEIITSGPYTLYRQNPDPDQWAGPGSRTTDEMSHAWIAVTHLDQEGYERLLAEREERARLTSDSDQ